MIQKFSAVGLIAFLLSGSAYADYSEIPVAKLASYKKAVELAGRNRLSCNSSGALTDSSNLIEYVLNANSGQIDASGSQPVLVFYRQISPTEKGVAQVVTSSDYKNIISYSVTGYEIQTVNAGTILNPNITQSYVHVGSAICK